ncbi:MAG: flavin reductase [Ruminococcus sp.]|nr:flavin reductase [Ruminococcus sp.]
MSFVKKDIHDLVGNPFNEIGKDWFLITAGNGSCNNTMTASWGFMGVIWGAPSFICAVRTNRHTFGFIEDSDVYTISFFDEQYRSALNFCGTKSGRDYDKAKETGLTPVEIDGAVTFAQAKRVFVCRKRYSEMMNKESFTDEETYNRWYSTDPMHKQYIGEIIAVYEKE